MNNKKRLDILADLQHEIWSHWMHYMFRVCIHNENGSYTIPAEKANRWKRQMITKYNDLSESEKESDREQAMKILHVLNLE